MYTRHSLAFAILFMLLLPARSQYITHGPATGGLTHNSARMYIRTTFTNPFTIEVDDDSTFASPQVINASADPLKDSSVVIDINGLQSNTYYYFRCKFNGNPDVRKGRFKTFPLPGEKTDFTLVTGSCQETANMDVFDRIRELEPLMLIHTGDWTYPSYQMDNTYPDVWATVQKSWQRRYNEYKMKDMLLTVPIDYVHDDDDGFGVAQNYWNSTDYYVDSVGGVHNYFTVDTLSMQGRYNHMRGYVENFPHYPMVDTAHGLFHSFVIGNTEVFFLDTRSEAVPSHVGFVFNNSTQLWEFNPDTSNYFIGPTQMSWLKQKLQNSTADWKIISCGLPFNKNLDILIAFGVFLQNSILTIGNETGTGMRLAMAFAGYWAGHPYEQKELLDFIEVNQIKDVLFISGDTHHNVIDDGRNAGLPEINASGLSVADLSLAYWINEYGAPLGYPVLDSLWNVGGNGLAPDTNLNNAFGQLDIYKGDSLRMCVVDEHGVKMACHTLINSSIVGLEQLPNKMFGTVYPNPTNGQLTISLNDQAGKTTSNALYMINTEGKFIRWISKTVKPGMVITEDISSLPGGIYYLVYEDDHNRSYFKIIKN